MRGNYCLAENLLASQRRTLLHGVMEYEILNLFIEWGSRKITVLRVSRQFPLVLTVNVWWKQVRILGNLKR
jgi:hypothetical protein